MKDGLTLKLMLKGTAACILLTLVWYFFIKSVPVRTDYFEEFELIAVWGILLIGWIVYFIGLIRKRHKKKEEEPWNRKEKDPW